MVSSSSRRVKRKEVERIVAFRNIRNDVQDLDVDPFSCISFVCIRKTMKSIDFRFESIFPGRGASNLGPASTRAPCGTEIAIVVWLETDYEYFVRAHLETQGL